MSLIFDYVLKMKPLEIELQEVKKDPRFEVDDKGNHPNSNVIDLIIYRSNVDNSSLLIYFKERMA
jgi:hypothetical protein